MSDDDRDRTPALAGGVARPDGEAIVRRRSARPRTMPRKVIRLRPALAFAAMLPAER